MSDEEHKRAVLRVWCDLNGLDFAAFERDLVARTVEIRGAINRAIFDRDPGDECAGKDCGCT